jgi:uncharacterized membrane protein
MKKIWKTAVSMMLAALLSLSVWGTAASAEGGVELYTPYTSVTVPPGESISYSVDVMNQTAQIQTVELAVESVPDKWDYELTAGGRSVQTISVKPKDSQNVNLQVNVPLEVEKGSYSIVLAAKGMASLPLTVNVSEKGTFKTELTTKQPNMEGHSDSTFNYTVTLKNRTAAKQLYALKADAPQGWDVQYSVDGKNVTSVNLDPNGSQDISITVRPPDQVKADTYKIPIHASGNGTGAQVELEAVVTGTYALELSTPSGNLSADITAGSTKKVKLKVTNKGTSPLKDIELSANTPTNWEVTFEPKKIASLEPGKSAEIDATIKADSKAIAGDYIVSLTAKTAEKSADAQLRMTVKTSVLWGWIGILIILAVIGGIAYLFRTYGRR